MGYTVGKKLYDEADAIVKAAQKANYVFLREKFPNIGSGTLKCIFKELVKRKTLRQTTKRRYAVIVNEDGTPKSEDTLPPPKKFAKLKLNRQKADVAPNGSAVDDREKLEFISTLTKSAGEKAARILKAVSEDVRFAAKHRSVVAALRE
jgi:hypothetical protein